MHTEIPLIRLTHSFAVQFEGRKNVTAALVVVEKEIGQ